MEITIMICNKKNILQFPSIKNSLFLQECLEEKKRSKDQLFNGNLSQVIDGLRDQLNSQKETMKKYEGKIKKRDAEVSQVKYMSLLLYVHRKRDDFSLSLYLPSHQGSTPPLTNFVIYQTLANNSTLPRYSNNIRYSAIIRGRIVGRIVVPYSTRPWVEYLYFWRLWQLLVKSSQAKLFNISSQPHTSDFN